MRRRDYYVLRFTGKSREAGISGDIAVAIHFLAGAQKEKRTGSPVSSVNLPNSMLICCVQAKLSHFLEPGID